MFIVILVNFVSKRAERQNQQTTQAFIEKEQMANTTRKKDISNLDFITIPVCISTPTGLISEEITDTEQQLSALSEKKIVNFTGITNTELKLAYGAPNIDILSEYDNNYLKLVRLLQKYATLLYDNNLKDKAIEVLEFSLSTKSDISASYTLLARIYKEQGRTEDIKKVIEKAESLDSMTKGKLLKDLNEILDSTD
ncbi:MAG: hypothetical protein MJ124_09840 [Lachnospiraceae bacterium]|nr:hypothetical protein [Lachnospiraceae bacterium]